MCENKNLAGHNPKEPESGKLSDTRENSFNLQLRKKAGTDPAHLALKIGLGIGVCPRFRTVFSDCFCRGQTPVFALGWRALCAQLFEARPSNSLGFLSPENYF
jgi:hypothetical protein